MANEYLQISGSVRPGFEAVRALYENNMRTLHERDTQLCVYHQGEKVVDLWASANPEFTADSLVNVFSSGKSLESIAMASLVDKGLIRYTDKIADHWPEFAANGKDETTIADLMRHEAGLAAFDTSIDPADLLIGNIKKNNVGVVIEKQIPRFPEQTGGKREYHAITRGWVANEVFRRADPQSRTIGEFLQEEVSGPLEADVHIGMQDADLPRVSKGFSVSFPFVLKESMKPKFLKRRIELNFIQLVKIILTLLPMLRRAMSVSAPAIKGMKGVGIFNDAAVAKGETPSANTHASARGLARIASMMSTRGRFNDLEVLGETGWAQLHGNSTGGSMMALNTVFTQGGVSEFRFQDELSKAFDKRFNNGRHGFYGWMGYGGSVFQWHPEHQIGFGYVPTSLHPIDMMNERGKAYQAEVLRCVEKLG